MLHWMLISILGKNEPESPYNILMTNKLDSSASWLKLQVHRKWFRIVKSKSEISFDWVAMRLEIVNAWIIINHIIEKGNV